jgi:uncharacterized cupin superfamily protein
MASGGFAQWEGGVAHWDDVDPRKAELGHISGRWRDLGRAAGSLGAGVKRIEIDPGKWSTPAHCEGAEEEIFYVLGGSGISWQDEQVYDVGEGDCIVHLPGAEVHTLRAGPEGLDVLAFGTRVAVQVGELPRAGVGWLVPTWVEVGKEPAPWQREVEAGEPPVGELSPRPANIVNVGDDRFGDAAWRAGRPHPGARRLAAAAGSRRAGLNHEHLDAGELSAPPHCHSAEEEIFVVLAGEGTLELTPAPVASDRGAGAVEQPLRAGSVVARPPGTRMAHALRAGAEGLTYLVYGTREPNDLAYYPRSNKVFFRGLGLIGRLESLDYWDGEPDRPG